MLASILVTVHDNKDLPGFGLLVSFHLLPLPPWLSALHQAKKNNVIYNTESFVVKQEYSINL